MEQTDRGRGRLIVVWITQLLTIPSDLLDRAKCVAIIPGDRKFAFIFGGSYGRGDATCRTAAGWSAPMFVAIDGGSVGYRIGGSSTDLVMLCMNDRALQSLLAVKDGTENGSAVIVL